MTSFAEITELLKSKFTAISEAVQETELYNNLNDRYQSLSTFGQKITQVVVIVVIVFLVLFTPLSKLQVSNEMLAQFEAQRSLIIDLFKTYRESPALSPIAQPPNNQELVSVAQSILQNLRLIPEQIQSVQIAQNAENSLIPQDFVASVVEVKLSKLNIRQIVDIGSRLGTISAAVKVKDLSIKAHADMQGYFDVTYKLFALKVPEPIIEAAPDVTEPKKKNSANNDESSEN